MKHPLINPNSPHYDKNGTHSILEMEKALTIPEMIGFCKGNIMKYQFRGNDKGDDVEAKIKTYQNYLEVLKPTLIYHPNITIINALRLEGIVWN